MLNNLQGLRALAATLVVFSHIAMMRDDLLNTPLRFGIHGVDLFFVISGFVMVHTTAGKAIGPGRFMLNRIVRIVPLYWGLTLALAAVALVAPTLLGSTSANAPDLLRSLFFIPFEKSPGVVQPFLFLGWTLNYEMFFYALFALSLVIRPLALRLVAMGAVLAAIVAFGQIARPSGAVAQFYTSPIILEFAFGMALGWLHHRTDFAAAPRAIAWAALVVAVVWVFAAIRHGVTTEDRLWAFGMPSTLVVLAALLFEAQGGRITNRLLLLIGAASYALYLSHPFVILPIEKVAGRLHLIDGPLMLGVVAACFVGAIVAAILIYRLIELPIAHRLRRLTRGASEARPATEQIQG